MRNRRILAAALSAGMTLGMLSTAFAGTWKVNLNGWWYEEDNGNRPVSEWKWIDGNSDGIAECYCFDGNGYLLVSTTTPEGFTVNADGQWTRDGKVQTKTEEELYYTYDPSSRIYAWMNGVYDRRFLGAAIVVLLFATSQREAECKGEKDESPEVS